MTAYAALEDVLALFETEPKDRRAARLEDLLETATAELVNECQGRDFFRHPTSGTRTWTASTPGDSVLHVHEGIASLDLLEISFDRGQSFVEIETTGYELVGADPEGSETPLAGEPYFHVRLFPFAPYPSFPRGRSTVRLTGATGWPAVPRVLVEATAERARQLAYSDPSYSGSVPGMDEMNPGAYAGDLTSNRWPQVLWNFLRADRLRFLACSM